MHDQATGFIGVLLVALAIASTHAPKLPDGALMLQHFAQSWAAATETMAEAQMGDGNCYVPMLAF